MDLERAVNGDSGNPAGDTDSLILVDASDREVGHMSKAQCHHGRGTLHRAFSLLIFNGQGELLLQQRAQSKRLWPLYWSNSVCSHPRQAESMEVATRRRLQEELGVRCPLQFLYKFEYQAQFGTAGAEHELCSVFIGRCTDSISPDRREILAWRWIAPQALELELQSSGAERFTPWFRLEWARVWQDHRSAVQALQ
jgi:isopentenyl-diphosphate delta-isomerase